MKKLDYGLGPDFDTMYNSFIFGYWYKAIKEPDNYIGKVLVGVYIPTVLNLLDINIKL